MQLNLKVFHPASTYTIFNTMNASLSQGFVEFQGNFVFPGTKFHVSVVGGLESDDPPQLETFDKVLRIVRERSQTEKSPLVSVATDPNGFLPTSFLETGLKYSQSVCRIARYFSLEEFRGFINQIQEAIATHATVGGNFDTQEDVIEVFSIPRQVADEIFKTSGDAPKKPLDVLRKITENQLAKINPIPIGTGFLVGGSHLLTNHHVIQSKGFAAQCVAQFNCVENAQGYIQKSIDYELDPILFVTEPGLDYTLVQLKSGMFTRQAGYEFDWLQLIEDEESVKPSLVWVEFKGTHKKVVSAWEASQDAVQQLRDNGYTVKEEAEAIVIWHPNGEYEQDEIKTIGTRMGYEQFADALKRVVDSDKTQKAKQEAKGDAVIIVQHPKGKQKQIVLSDNKITQNGLYQQVLRYKAQSDYGSSGSPVFNTHWKLVALHHAAVPDSSESSAQSQQTANRAVNREGQGIRICRIIEDLRRKSVTNSKLRSFIQDFVITAEQLNYPPLPAVARLGRDEKNGYFDCGNDESLVVSEALTVEAWVAKYDDENGAVFSQNDEKNGYWVWWFMGKIRVQFNSNPRHGIISDQRHSIIDTIKPAPQDGLWHHIAFTWSKSKKAQIYIDGEPQETVVSGGDDLLKTPIGIINAPVLIGAWVGERFRGAIAEVRLWKTARSENQIKETTYQRLTGDHSAEGLIGRWQFEEDRASKTYVYNLASPDGGSTVPFIAPFTSDPKKPQFGLELNGETDYVDCGSFAIENAITFEAWVKLNGRDQKSFIVGQGGFVGGPGYSLSWWNRQICVNLQGKDYEDPRPFGVDMPDDNDWHHIAFTWSSDSPNICVYIDGKGFQDPKPFIGPIGAPALNLCIGRNKAVNLNYFKGSIAEVRLWNVARTPEQINDCMNRTLEVEEINKINQPEVQLVGYWPLNEQEGKEASNPANQGSMGDQPGLVHGGIWLKPKYAVPYSQGNYGVRLGDVKWLKSSECPASLPLPCGLKFSSKDDQVNCGHDPSLNITDAITVEAWVKHRLGNCLIVSRGCYEEEGYSLCWYGGKIRVMFQGKTANEKLIVDTEEIAPVDQVWHHIAFTWDKNLKEVFIYVDGRQQDCVVMEGQTKSIAYAGQTKSTGLFSGSLADLKTDLVIGGCKPQDEQYYNVTIAEVRLWKVARTQDEIKTNMTCRLSRRDDDWKYLLGYWRLDDGGAGNTQARNLKSDSNHGEIKGAQWFPAPPSSTKLSQASTSKENPSNPSV